MGLFHLSSSTSYITNDKHLNPNPNPNKFKIVRYKIYYGKIIVSEINYPDCTNYEGNKIMVFTNIRINNLKNAKYIDPHFTEERKPLTPVARFEPTDLGWELACETAKYLSKKAIL